MGDDRDASEPFFDGARGSAIECAACLDASVAKGVASLDRIQAGKELLVRIVAMHDQTAHALRSLNNTGSTSAQQASRRHSSTTTSTSTIDQGSKAILGKILAGRIRCQAGRRRSFSAPIVVSVHVDVPTEGDQVISQKVAMKSSSSATSSEGEIAKSMKKSGPPYWQGAIVAAHPKIEMVS